MNHVYMSLIEAQLKAFASEFSDTAKNVFHDQETKRLIHPGEFGSFREGLVRSLLLNFLPESYGISQGFLISPEGAVSKQCDIVVYSRTHTPVIRSAEQQRFFPVESVVAVGEVKSTISRADLADACGKLRLVKEMRAGLSAPSIAFSIHKSIGEYSARDLLHDQLATFIVANEIHVDPAEVDGTVDAGSPSDPSLRVNLVLDVGNWCGAYRDLKGLLWPYPVDVGANHRVVPCRLPLELYRASEDRLRHLRMFLYFVQLLVTRATVLYPNLHGYWNF